MSSVGIQVQRWKLHLRARTFDIFIALILLIPRIIRLEYPLTWLQQPHFLYYIRQIANGAAPYRDVSISYPPLIEYFYAAFVAAGADLLTVVRLLNALTIYLVSLSIYFYMRDRMGRRPALISGLLFACHSLVFRSDLFAREFTECLLLLWALNCVDVPRKDGDNENQAARMAAAGVCVGLAVLCKQSAAVIGSALGLVMLLRRRSFFDFIAFGAGALLIVATGLGYLDWRYGDDFRLQVVVFHMAIGSSGRDLVSQIEMVRHSLDLGLTLGLIGSGVAILVRRKRHLIPATLMAFAALIFHIGLSGKYWAENGIEILVWLCIPGGWVAWWAASTFSGKNQADASGKEFTAALIAIALAVVSSLWLAPINNDNWRGKLTYGFGGIKISSIRQIAEEVRTRTRQDEPCIAHPAVAALADRIDPFFLRENAGLQRLIEHAWKTGGLDAAKAVPQNRFYVDLCRQTASVWLRPAVEALRSGKIRCVVPDAWTFLSNGDLAALRLKMVMSSDGLSLWIREP